MAPVLNLDAPQVTTIALVCSYIVGDIAGVSMAAVTDEGVSQ